VQSHIRESYDSAEFVAQLPEAKSRGMSEAQMFDAAGLLTNKVGAST
jgi:hypothetical protein